MDASQLDFRWFKARELGFEPHALVKSVLNRLRPDIQRRREIARRNAAMVGLDLSRYGLNDAGMLFNEAISFNAAKNARHRRCHDRKEPRYPAGCYHWRNMERAPPS